MSGTAQAAVYRLVGQQYDAFTVESGAANGAQFSLGISDEAVARGSFTYTSFAGGSGNANPTGDVADFRFAFTRSESIPAVGQQAGLSALLTFAPGGTVTSANVRVTGIGNDLIFSGTGGAVSGTFGGDSTSCSSIPGPTACRFTAQFVDVNAQAVPEPATMALLAMGLLGVAATRRRV